MPGIDWREERADGKGRELLETIIEEGLQQLVSFPTHIKGNMLDLVITNCADRVLEVCDVGRLGKSDHCMLSIVVEGEPQTLCQDKERYVWGKANMDAIKDDLDGIDWKQEMGQRTVDEAWNFLTTRLQETIDRNVPKGQHRTKFKHPWMNREILRLVRKKRRAWRNYKFTASLEDREAYKRIEKETANKIRNAKRKMEKELSKNKDKNNRQFTKYVKAKTKSKTTVGPLITKEKKLLTGGKEIADELNKFFASVFTKEDTTTVPDAEQEEVKQRMEAIRISERDVSKKIRNLRKNAASGPDGISPKLLQELESSFLTPLALLFNKSVSTGEVPLGWKTAKVCPIFKKGTKGDPGNYRPVSLTSVICRLLESIIKDKVTEHLMENGLIRDTQHGFMPGKSCATNLVEFMDTVTKAADEGKAVDIFYLDFAKAFDKVPRQRLLNKMRAKGIHTGIIKWIEAWLTGRTQRVTVQGELSEECEVESGVPQGTVLGPTLFTIYIDDLEAEIERRKLEVLIKKFADDTKGAKIIQKQEDNHKLQEALDCLCEWAEKWGMSFNYGKCKIMHIGKNNPRHEYFMRGNKLTTTEEERDVGVIFTSNLKPSAQCSKAAGCATSVLNQLKRNFHFRDRHIFVNLYKQYVRPHLEFSSQAWSPWLIGDIEVIEKVQEKAVRMVTGLKGTTYEEKCTELGLETLKIRRERQDMALTHKYVMNEEQGLFTLASNNRGARTRRAAGEKCLVKQFARTDTRKNFFAVRAVDSWNDLPDSVRAEEKLPHFKRKLKGLVA
jgi:hypothetical protein